MLKRGKAPLKAFSQTKRHLSEIRGVFQLKKRYFSAKKRANNCFLPVKRSFSQTKGHFFWRKEPLFNFRKYTFQRKTGNQLFPLSKKAFFSNKRTLFRFQKGTFEWETCKTNFSEKSAPFQLNKATFQRRKGQNKVLSAKGLFLIKNKRVLFPRTRVLFNFESGTFQQPGNTQFPSRKRPFF